MNKQTPREIMAFLADKNKKYDMLYEDTMKGIERSEHAEIAKKALSWVVLARRPLTTSELLHALAVNPGDTARDDDDVRDMDGVVSACAGLLTVDEGSDSVRLMHNTAHEYLTSESGNKALSDAETYITNICITYLSFGDFEGGFCATDADLEARLSKHPFYRYAARNWGYHASKISLSPSSNSGLRIFLGSASKTESAGQAMMAIKERSPWAGYSQEVPRGVTGLHLAARFGATAIVSDLLAQCETGGCDVRESHQRTPLMWAVAVGNLEMVRMLLGSGADPNLKDKDGRTPLSLAAENGSTGIVEALLGEERLAMGGDAQKDEVGCLPLSWAARNGHADVVRVLLARSNLEGGEADNALSWAILQDSETVVRLILEAALEKAGPEWGKRMAPKALCWAAGIGRVPMFAYLLSALGGDVNCLGGDVNCRGGNNRKTPLMEAALRGHVEMVADPSMSDQRGQTAFCLAAAYGHDALVSLLLLHAPTKIGVDGADKGGRTPLSLAAENGHDAIVRTLLGLEGDVVSIDAGDRSRQTPLFWAARGGHSAIVKQLLETGKVDIDAKTVLGQTALSEAVAGYCVATVKLLKEHGAVDTKAEPLSWKPVKAVLSIVPQFL